MIAIPWDRVIVQAIQTLMAGGAAWALSSLFNYYRTKRLAHFLAGTFNEYWPPRTGEEAYLTGSTTFRFRVFGPALSLCPFHNILVRSKSPDLDLDIVYYAKATKAGNVLEIEMRDLSTGHDARFMLTIPAYLNQDVLGGVGMALSMTGEPMAWPVIFSRQALSPAEVLCLLDGEKAIRWSSPDHLSRVAHVKSQRRNGPAPGASAA